MGLGLIALIVGYFFKDILKWLIIIGLIVFVMVYKIDSVRIMYEAVLSIIGYMKGAVG